MMDHESKQNETSKHNQATEQQEQVKDWKTKDLDPPKSDDDDGAAVAARLVAELLEFPYRVGPYIDAKEEETTTATTSIVVGQALLNHHHQTSLAKDDDSKEEDQVAKEEHEQEEDEDDTASHTSLLHRFFSRSGALGSTGTTIGSSIIVNTEEVSKMQQEIQPNHGTAKDRETISERNHLPSEHQQPQSAKQTVSLSPKDILRQVGMNIPLPSGLGLSFDSTDDTSVEQNQQQRKPHRELAHDFVTYSYSSPTYCDVCDGLLVGLWRQGMQCQTCKMNIHHGPGKGEHDDCRAEALLTSCHPTNHHHNNNQRVNSTAVNPSVFLPNDNNSNDDNNAAPFSEKNHQHHHHSQSSSNPLQNFQQLLHNHPNLWQEVKEQLDKDAMNNVKQIIVKEGADDERTKKIRRLREQIILPMVTRLRRIDHADDDENDGRVRLLSPWAYAHLVLLYHHFILTVGVSFFTAFLLGLVLIPTRNGLTFHGLLLHISTVMVSFSMGIVVTSYLIHVVSIHFQRKEMIVDNFLQQMLTIQAQDDFGISVMEAAALFRLWSGRFFNSSVLMHSITLCLFYQMESSYHYHNHLALHPNATS